MSNFDYFNKILQVSEDQKLRIVVEVIQGTLLLIKLIVKANRNPISVIFGSSGDSAKILSDEFDAVESEREARKKEQNVKLYKLLLALNALDLQLMQTSVSASKKYAYSIANRIGTKFWTFER